MHIKLRLLQAGGAFSGIDKMISKRLNMQAVGFSASMEDDKIDEENLLQYIIYKISEICFLTSK